MLRVNANYAQMEEAKRVHRAEWNEYNKYYKVQDILTQQLLEGVHEYYKSQFKTELGYECTLTQLLEHPKETYCKKTSTELKENKKKMQQPWIPTAEPIEALFSRVDEGIILL